MKHLTLRDVMARMSITVNGDGFEVTNPAGTAQYDAWGSRTTVNGIPEYFPLQLSVSGVASFENTAPSGGYCSMSMGVVGSNSPESSPIHTNKRATETKPIQTLSIKVEADTSELEKKLDEINNLIKTAQPLSSLTAKYLSNQLPSLEIKLPLLKLEKSSKTPPLIRMLFAKLLKLSVVLVG